METTGTFICIIFVYYESHPCRNIQIIRFPVDKLLECLMVKHCVPLNRGFLLATTKNVLQGWKVRWMWYEDNYLITGYLCGQEQLFTQREKYTSSSTSTFSRTNKILKVTLKVSILAFILHNTPFPFPFLSQSHTLCLGWFHNHRFIIELDTKSKDGTYSARWCSG